MAVLEGFEGVEVTVCVDDEALPEYDDDDIEGQSTADSASQESKVVSKYIEAQTGKKFIIRLSVQSPYTMDCPTLCFHVKVDGKTISRHILRKSVYKRHGVWTYDIIGVKHAPDEESRQCSIDTLQFMEIQTSKFLTKTYRKFSIECF